MTDRTDNRIRQNYTNSYDDLEKLRKGLKDLRKKWFQSKDQCEMCGDAATVDIFDEISILLGEYNGN